ncbi:O-antigen ligase family protein [Deinococcus maricopensis]|uniref:O-antigen ligase family protein n=1 Tax=Deinococcus maricopensis TaxID=309887 RepID=UPI00145E91E9|nr:O-antigen ligase family protein [Deinococcus maricopensis]
MVGDIKSMINGAPDRYQGLPIYISYSAILVAAFTLAKSDFRSFSNRIGIALSWTCVPLCLYSIAQYYDLLGVIGLDTTSGIMPTVAGSTLGNKGYLAGLLSLLLPICLHFSDKKRGLLLSVLLCGAGMTVTSTRGAMLAALVGIFTLIIQKRRLLIIPFFVVVVGLLLPVLPFGSKNARVYSDGLSNSSGRSVLWWSAIYGIQQKPVFGWGPGHLIDIMAQRRDVEILQEMNIKTQGKVVERLPFEQGGALQWRFTSNGKSERVFQNINAVHNEYLEYALNFGIPTAISFVLLFLLGILRSWKKSPWAASALLAYMVYLLTWPESLRLAPIAWAILGIAYAVSSEHVVSSRIQISERS